jgi:hypothetical protein
MHTRIDDPATTFLTTADIIATAPGRAGRLAPSTVTRWICKGVALPTGGRVRLRATRLASRWLIAPADWHAFLEAMTAAHVPAGDAPAPRTPNQQRRAAASAGDALAAEFGV